MVEIEENGKIRIDAISTLNEERALNEFKTSAYAEAAKKIEDYLLQRVQILATEKVHMQSAVRELTKQNADIEAKVNELAAKLVPPDPTVIEPPSSVN